MTFRSDEEESDESQPSRPSYEVGYGKPPAEHRFKKGRSGNPLGRPRKPKVAKSADSFEFGKQPASQYLIKEAYRPVMVREGEQAIQLPAIQAVFRAMGVAAMKGNRFAQRTLAELVQAVEAEDQKTRLQHLEAAIEYKVSWERVIEQARELGRPEPQPIPHPDDVIIDFANGRAKICGPMTKEDKVKWDALLAFRDDMQSGVSDYAARYRRCRSAEKKAQALDMWMFEQKHYDQINDNLPARYRRNLTDRCWKDCASRPGRKARWPGDD